MRHESSSSVFSHPASDLLLTLLLTPLWWLLGAGIFVYHAASVIAVLKLFTELLKEHKPLKMTPAALFLGCFIVTFLLSIAINAPNYPAQRILASINNVLLFMAGAGAVIVIYHGDIEKWAADLCRASKFLAMMSGSIALFFLYLWCFKDKTASWNTLTAKIFPSLTAYPFFSNLLVIRVTAEDWASEILPRVSIYSTVTTASGGFMLMILPLAIANMRIQNKFRMSDAAACLLGAVPLVFSLSRTAICAFAGASFFVWFLDRRGKIIWAGLFFVLAMLGSGLIYDGIQWLLNARSSSTVGRFELYQEAVRIALRENWLLGIGVRLREGFTLMSVGSHSTYVGVFLMTGVLGTLFFFLFQCSLFAGWYQIRNKIPTPSLKVFWKYIGVSALGVNIWILTDGIDGLPFIAFTYFVITGSILLLTRASADRSLGMRTE